MPPTPLKVPIQSATLAAAGHDESRSQLHLDFVDGSRYEYFGVPAQTFRDFLGAPSKGSFFNRHIRGRFRYIKCAPQN